MPNQTRYKTYYWALKTQVIAALGLNDVQGWNYEGSGMDGKFLIRHTDVENPGNPIPGLNQVREPEEIIPFADLKAQFFSSISDEVFRKLTVDVISDPDKVFFHLNLEEHS